MCVFCCELLGKIIKIEAYGLKILQNHKGQAGRYEDPQVGFLCSLGFPVQLINIPTHFLQLLMGKASPPNGGFLMPLPRMGDSLLLDCSDGVCTGQQPHNHTFQPWLISIFSLNYLALFGKQKACRQLSLMTRAMNWIELTSTEGNFDSNWIKMQLLWATKRGNLLFN